MKIRLLIALSLLATASYAAPVSIIATGTAWDGDIIGYTNGQNYTFTWVVNDGYNGGVWDDFPPHYNRWFVGFTNDPILWNSISGSGLREEYSRLLTDPFEMLTVENDYLNIDIHREGSPQLPLGLKTSDGLDVSELYVYS